jgi:hypothetical protein
MLFWVENDIFLWICLFWPASSKTMFIFFFSITISRGSLATSHGTPVEKPWTIVFTCAHACVHYWAVCADRFVDTTLLCYWSVRPFVYCFLFCSSFISCVLLYSNPLKHLLCTCNLIISHLLQEPNIDLFDKFQESQLRTELYKQKAIVFCY